jgi:hypothetical protein
METLRHRTYTERVIKDALPFIIIIEVILYFSQKHFYTGTYNLSSNVFHGAPYKVVRVHRCLYYDRFYDIKGYSNYFSYLKFQRKVLPIYLYIGFGY